MARTIARRIRQAYSPWVGGVGAMAGWLMSLLAAGGAALSGCKTKPVAPVAAAGSINARPCSAQVPLSFGRAVYSNNQRGPRELQGSCIKARSSECGFAFELSGPAEVRFALLTLDFDGALVLYRRDADGPHELNCVDDTPFGNPHHARIETTLDAGSYLLVVDSAGDETGDFELYAERIPLPSRRESCVTASAITPAHPARGSLRGMPDLFETSCAPDAPGPDAVHRLELSEPSRVRLRLDAETDASLALRAGCEATGGELACGRIGAGPASVVAEAGAGSYIVLVAGTHPSAAGDYTLSVEQIPVPPASSAAQACESRATWSEPAQPFELDTFYAAAALAGSCGGAGAPEVPLRLVVARPSVLLAELQDAELEAAMYLRRRCADAHSELACIQVEPLPRGAVDASGGPATLRAELAPGEYTLVVDGLTPAQMGAASLVVNLSPL